MEQEIVAPSVHLLDSMRSIGYSLEAAVADLIDNSITAEASSIIIDVDVVNAGFVALLDNGHGMSPVKSREALRLAGSAGERTQTDLGRFGLGLKTASLSQARCLTVVTKDGDKTTGLRWDIDHVLQSEKWNLLVLDTEDLKGLPLWSLLDSYPSGTLVVWQRLDLLVGDATDPSAFLAERLAGLRDSLSLVFHRFLGGSGGLRVEVNGVVLKPIDPFLVGNPKTQRTPTERIPIGDASVEVTAFTLPHPSALTVEDRKRPDLGYGMRDAQGFYVYRNKRLVSRGQWYGLARMSELSKQTRIRVDVPTSLDRLWQLDVKKSRAEPPQSFKLHLRRLIDPIIERGRRVHTFRGRKANDSEVEHLWIKQKTREGFVYEINLQHALVVAVLASLPSGGAGSVLRLFQTLANCFPLLDAYQELAGNVLPSATEITSEELLVQLREIHESGVLNGDSRLVAEVLSRVEPFDKVKELSRFVDQVWKAEDGTV